MEMEDPGGYCQLGKVVGERLVVGYSLGVGKAVRWVAIFVSGSWSLSVRAYRLMFSMKVVARNDSRKISSRGMTRDFLYSCCDSVTRFNNTISPGLPSVMRV